MQLLPQLALSLALLSGASSPSIVQSLEQARTQGHLPLSFALAVSEELETVFHHDGDLAMAYYRPPPPAGEREGTVRGEASGRPQLVLYRPHYEAGDRLVDLLKMPVDAAEYFLHALLLAYLHLEVLETDNDYRAILSSRAQEVMTDVPQEHRLEAYVRAVVSFGSHVLSLANELEKASLRRRAEGRNLCSELEQGATLFGLWQKAFDAGAYPGSYTDPGAGAGSSGGGLVYSRKSLERQDKLLLVRHVLEDAWTGDPTEDFGGRYCDR